MDVNAGIFSTQIALPTPPGIMVKRFARTRPPTVGDAAVAWLRVAPNNWLDKTYLLVPSSNTMISGGSPDKPSSFQRETTLSYVSLSSFVRGENVFMCL